MADPGPSPRGRARRSFSRHETRRQVGSGDSRIRAGHRIFLHDRGELFFGPGVFDLLVLTDREGSLRQAAKEMGMAYSKAWTSMRQAEDFFGIPLLHRQAGGPTGGGSVLTAEGHDLVARYRSFLDEADAALEQIFRKHFADAPYAQPLETRQDKPELDTTA